MGDVFPPAEGQPTTARMLTAEESDVLVWLLAEREWQAELWRAQAERDREHEEAQLEAQAHAEFEQVKADHTALVASAAGLRRVLLARHEPMFNRSYRGKAFVECCVCYAGQDHNYGFPCDDYELAAGWSM